METQQRKPKPAGRGPPPKSRPSLADSGLLDGILFEPDPVITFEPLKPTKYYYPEQLGSAIKLMGSEDVIDHPDADSTRRSKNSLQKVPSFALQGLGQASTRSSSSMYPSLTQRSGKSSHAMSETSSWQSSAWSTISNRLFSNVVPETVTSTQLEPGMYTKEYDKLAKKHGLQPFPPGYIVESSSASMSSVSFNKGEEEGIPKLVASHGPIRKGTRILNRLLKRTDSTKDVSERSWKTSGHPLEYKRVSVSDLAGMGRPGRKDHLRGMHLEDMVRLMGVCEFHLPDKMTPGKLLIPACFHATASYILANGLTSPGIFRVAGSPRTTEALYDYYQRQLANAKGDSILQTTSLASLPTHLTYTVNDVAHLLKALIAGLPGGLLGSPAVFQALYNVHAFSDPSLNPQMTKGIKPRMIALAIGSVNLHFRISLICAVFGLLRYVALSTHYIMGESKILMPAETFTLIKEDSLGVNFAPLLLGDKSDQILVSAHEERGGLLVLPTVAPQSDKEPTKGKYKQKKSQSYYQVQREKARRAVVVTELIIAEWENVVVEMKKLAVLEQTAKKYDMPGGSSKASSEALEAEQPQSDQLEQERRKQSLKADARKDERNDERNDEPSSCHQSQPLERGRRTSKKDSLGHSKSFKNLTGSLHRSKSKPSGFLHFPNPRHSSKTTRASDMNTSLMPPHLIGEQDLFETEGSESISKRGELGEEHKEKEMPSSEMEGLSLLDLDFSKTLKQEARAASLHEGTYISAANVANSAAVLLDPPVQRENLRGDTDRTMDLSAMNAMSEESSMSTDPIVYTETGPITSTGLERKLEISSTVLYIPATNSSGTKALLKDPELVQLLLVKQDEEEPIPPNQNPTSNVALDPREPELDDQKFKDQLQMTSPNLQFGQGNELKCDQAQTPILTLTRPWSGHKIVILRETEGNSCKTLQEVDEKLPDSIDITGDDGIEALRGDATPRPKPHKTTMDIYQKDNSSGSLAASCSAHEFTEIQDSDFEDKYAVMKQSQKTARKNDDESPQPPTTTSLTLPDRQRSVGQRTPSTSSQILPASAVILPPDMRSNSALYAEIRRLRNLVEIRTEEAKQSRTELELARKMANSGTLTQLLRDSKEEAKLWRSRAEWAEKKVRELMEQQQGFYGPQQVGVGAGDVQWIGNKNGGWEGRCHDSNVTDSVFRVEGKRVGSWGVGMEPISRQPTPASVIRIASKNGFRI